MARGELMNINYPKYEAYKETGIQWLPQVPAGWEVKQIRHLLDSVQNGTTATQVDYDAGKTIPVTRIETISGGEINWDKVGWVIPTKEIANYRLNKGDILFSHINSLSMIGNCALYNSNDALYGGMNLLRLKPKESTYSAWIIYLLKSKFIRNTFESIAKPAINQASLTTQGIKSCNVPVPPLPEQKAIAAFLDEKTGKIDSLLEKLKRQKELLSEKRTALITRAVTKGLNPNAPMKETGIDWLPQVPEHWEVVPTFAVFNNQKNKNVNSLESNVLSLSYGRILRRNVETNFGLLPESFETYQIVLCGNIILRLTDLQNDKRSLRVGLVMEKGIITSAYLCLKVKNEDKVLSSYAFNLLHSFDITKIFYNMGSGVRQLMTFEDLRRMPIIVPPISEQKEIAEYIEKQTAKIDLLQSKTDKQIELLKEYRTSLITSAVTGQIKVIQNQQQRQCA